MWGNTFIAGWLDRYLARTNYQAQQTNEPEDPSRPSNLWEPVRGDYGAHGRFDDRAQQQSVQWWAVEHIGWYKGAAALCLLIGAMAVGGVLAARPKGTWCCRCGR